jgi:hypothetical protein
MIDHWLDEIEGQVRDVLKERGPLSARDLGCRLGVSEASAVSFIGLLASSGRLVIERVGLPRRARDRRDADLTSTLAKAT